MLDIFNIPEAHSALSAQIFTPGGSSLTTEGWRTWTKPRGCSWIYMFMQASGGAAGGGASGAATTGAGGGGAGGNSKLWIPACFVPDIIYVRPARGTAGGIAANNGAAGVTSYIALRPEVTQSSLILSQGSGGLGSSVTSGGAAGGIGAIGSQGPWVHAGMYVSFAGLVGSAGAGAANAAGVAIAVAASNCFVTGGAGGGNGTGAGGAAPAAAAGYYPIIAGGVGTTGGEAAHGFNLGQTLAFGPKVGPWIFGGGAGGGGVNTAAVAGVGGAAAWGCGGGGGGGSSLAGGTGGAGGRGGDGFILILAG